MRADSRAPIPLALASSAGDSGGSFLHLSLWKPKRSTEWTTPRLTYGELAFLLSHLHQHPHRTHVLILWRASVVGSSHVHTPYGMCIFDAHSPLLYRTRYAPPEAEAAVETQHGADRGRCGAACSRGRLLGCALRPPHPSHTLLPPLLSGGVRGAHLRLPDPAYRGPGVIPARLTRALILAKP